MELSRIGRRLAGHSGILELMDDLGAAMASDPEMRMMGGGNPAGIPEMNAVWRRRMEEILADGDRYEKMLGNYDQPAGNPGFRDSLAGLLGREFGWSLTRENIGVTSGGQAAFFYLFNMLAGEAVDGRRKKILLPLVPEYIGYADQGAEGDLFVACEPRMELFDDRTFKYRIDFGAVEAKLGDDVAAVCVSRPTNPSGNVLTDEEVKKLSELCRERGKILILDNAYGVPFPGILFSEATPIWDEHIVVTLSLSKLGLPGTRTGIVVARREIVRAISAVTSVVGLANGNLGQEIVRPLLDSGEILKLSRDVVRPYYQRRSEEAMGWVLEALPPELPCLVHKSEGALFLWLWFRGLPVTTRVLYERLKARKVLVVPGSYFFFGLEAEMAQEHECIRVTFSQHRKVVQEGIEIIAEEVVRAYG